MKIKIIKSIPVECKLEIGSIHKVVKINKRSIREGGDIEFIVVNGEEIGILKHERELIESED